MRESDPPQPGDTNQSAEPPPLPPPPVTPVLHEYSWSDQINTSATFSIVTTGGSVYLATMVWVEGGNVHFNSVDGGRAPDTALLRFEVTHGDRECAEETEPSIAVDAGSYAEHRSSQRNRFEAHRICSDPFPL